MWADIKGEVQDYEKEKANFALYTRGQQVEEVSPCTLINSVQNGVVWETMFNHVMGFLVQQMSKDISELFTEILEPNQTGL